LAVSAYAAVSFEIVCKSTGETSLQNRRTIGMQRQYYPLHMEVNGRNHEIEVESHELLLDVMRDRLNLTGAKRSCDVQVCGACTVLVDGNAVSACTYLAVDALGKKILTIEGLASGDELHPLQEAFIEHAGFQCGFCTSGMILTAKALLDENPSPSRSEVKAYLGGNICRCTGYRTIVDSILAAAGRLNQ
jgi:carbon-monoxide dehydrogenase small subunit